MKIEVLPLVVNIICTLFYVFKGAEPGKMMYWGGATLLVLGLMRMKG